MPTQIHLQELLSYLQELLSYLPELLSYLMELLSYLRELTGSFVLAELSRRFLETFLAGGCVAAENRVAAC